MRVRTWQSNLQALIADRDAKMFAWGTNDCCTFACDAVIATTGCDPAAGLREHRTASEAAATLSAHGGVRALADARLGPRVNLKLVQVGDIGIVDTPIGPALAVWGGSQWLAPQENVVGLLRLPMQAAHFAWRGECRA